MDLETRRAPQKLLRTIVTAPRTGSAQLLAKPKEQQVGGGGVGGGG